MWYFWCQCYFAHHSFTLFSSYYTCIFWCDLSWSPNVRGVVLSPISSAHHLNRVERQLWESRMLIGWYVGTRLMSNWSRSWMLSLMILLESNRMKTWQWCWTHEWSTQPIFTNAATFHRCGYVNIIFLKAHKTLALSNRLLNITSSAIFYFLDTLNG